LGLLSVPAHREDLPLAKVGRQAWTDASFPFPTALINLLL